MSLNPDRSEDNELKIKALDRIVVRDWHRLDVSQTEEQDIVTTQVALKAEEACQNGSVQAKIDIEKDEEAAVELGITQSKFTGFKCTET
jgi:hypothetical protein